MSRTDPFEALQSCLERAYEIRLPWRAGDFVVAGAVPAGSAAPRAGDERVLVRQEGDALEIALCFAPGLHERLHSGEPLTASDFSLALEGVSHFVCIAWHAGHGRQITPVELELQAEIDKLLGLMFFQDAGGDPPQRLHGWLYAEGGPDPGLTAHERTRYGTANRLAARYWLALLRRYPAGLRDPALGRELRRFYRLPREAKLRRTSGPV